MADLTLAECGMFSKYYGDKDLVNNEAFWEDCLLFYSDRNIPLPLADNSDSRRRLRLLLKCPPGKCGVCCQYRDTPISESDLQIIKENWQKEDMDIADFESKYIKKKDDGSLFMDTSKGCPFMVDNSCTIYEYRPAICGDFPIQKPRESLFNNQQKFLQLVYRLKCPASLDVIKTIMKEATDGGQMLLLPDLSLVAIKGEK